MRILILNERDPRHPKAGGAETHVHEVFRRLAARGHAVTELVSSFPGGAARDEIDAIRFERIAALPTYYPRAAARCARATRRGEFDVVVECLNKLPFLAPLYSARPVLGLCHHLFGATAFRQVAWPIAAAVVAVERAIPLAYRRAPIVAISESTRDDLVARGDRPAQVEVQVPGIRRPDAQPAPIARREPLVVYVGRLEAYKRIDLVLEAVAQLARAAPRRPARAARARRGARRGSSAAPRRSGSATAWSSRASSPTPSATRGSRASRVCVCASHKEGFGLTVIEANAVGTPNVASDAPGLRDTVRHGETGFLVAEPDPARFAERIDALLGDDALAERMSRAALAWSQRFDWEIAADAMERSLHARRGKSAHDCAAMSGEDQSRHEGGRSPTAVARGLYVWRGAESRMARKSGRAMSSKWRIGLPQLLPIAVSAAALVWLLRGVDLPAVAAAVNTRVATVMLPALVAFCAVTLWIEAMSIHRLVANPPPGFGLWSAARIKCASYLPALLHYTLGVGGLAVLLRRRTGLSLGEALGLVLLISTTDLIVVLAAASSSAALLGVEPHVMRTGHRRARDRRVLRRHRARALARDRSARSSACARSRSSRACAACRSRGSASSSRCACCSRRASSRAAPRRSRRSTFPRRPRA